MIQVYLPIGLFVSKRVFVCFEIPSSLNKWESPSCLLGGAFSGYVELILRNYYITFFFCFLFFLFLASNSFSYSEPVLFPWLRLISCLQYSKSWTCCRHFLLRPSAYDHPIYPGIFPSERTWTNLHFCTCWLPNPAGLSACCILP